MAPNLTIDKWSSSVAAKAGNCRRLPLIFLFFVFSAIAPQQALAADAANSFSTTYINRDHGLPQNSVRAMQVDLDGFLWVGTEKGLSRFDGKRFINFSDLNADIPQDVSLGLEVDSKNRIWTIWYRHSLRLLAANRKDVLIIHPAEGYPDDLTECIPNLLELENGDIWFPGRINIYHIDPDNRIVATVVEEPITSDGILSGKKIVYGTRAGLLFVDTETSGIEYINVPPTDDLPLSSTWMVTTYDNDLLFCHSTGIFSYNPQKSILSQILTTTDYRIRNCKQLGATLIISLIKPGSARYKIITLDMQTGKIVPNQAGLPKSADTRNGVSLQDAFVDSSNNYWVMLGDRLLQSHGPGSKFQALELPVEPFGRQPVFEQSLAGVIWVRTDGNGLVRFSRYARRFQTTAPPTGLSPSTRVRSIAVDNDDNVWLVGDETRLLYWNRSQDTWADRLPGNSETIKGLQILPDGTVWITLQSLNKILGFDTKTGTWQYSYKIRKLSPAFSQTADGQLLAASADNIIIIDPQTGQRESITSKPLVGQIRSLEQDKKGNTWVGTHEAGLTRIDASGHTRSWTTKNSELSSDQIFSLHFDDNGLLWIGTWHGGLLSFDPVTEKFSHFGQEDGLPDATIFGILEDDGGHLWLSTYSGLVRFTPCARGKFCKPEMTTFNHYDGLQSDEFDADSYFQSSRGELLFAGAKGFNAFYPQDIRINRQPPGIAISRALLNDGPLPGADSEFTFPASVQLPFGFGELKLEISILDFNNPVKNRLQYRDSAEGSIWKNLEQGFLFVHGLNDGTHAFQFRGSNNDGFWSTHNAEIKFVVAPPLYRNPLMLVLYLLLLILVPGLYFRRRQTQLLVHQRILEARVAKRTRALELANSSRERFFANISHEISSPVHMILLMLENHMNEASGESKALYKSATAYAAQLMVYLKQLVSEARSHEVDSHLYTANLGRIIERLAATNQAIATVRSVSLSVEPLPSASVELYASSAVSIFSNLLCNALIYTPKGGEILIKGTITENLYRLTFTNTISPDQSPDIKRLLERGVRDDFNANYFGGHGIGLSIVTSAIEVLNGKIDVRLEGDNRIVFTVGLPLASHPMPELPGTGDLAFSYEQTLAIRLKTDEENHRQIAIKPLNMITVLIVEDDPLAADLIRQSLSQHYLVYVAGTGREGVQLAHKYHPTVILCDLFLPDESGFQVLQAVRANRMTMDTFFVMVTASISEQDRLRGQQLGVDQFIRKPVAAATLKLLIKNHFELTKQRSDHLQKEKLIRKARIDKVQSSHYSFATSFTEAIEELYQNPDTTIEDIQARLSMGYAMLLKNCKKTFGKSPKRLLIEKRVAVAKELLISSEYKVGLISELAGFSAHSQCAIVFKKETGMTPIEFRKKM